MWILKKLIYIPWPGVKDNVPQSLSGSMILLEFCIVWLVWLVSYFSHLAHAALKASISLYVHPPAFEAVGSIGRMCWPGAFFWAVKRVRAGQAAPSHRHQLPMRKLFWSLVIREWTINICFCFQFKILFYSLHCIFIVEFV